MKKNSDTGAPSTRALKAAIVGLGRIGSLLEEDPLREKPCTHAGAIAANADCVLVGGADLDGERRRRFAERWDCPVYAEAERMLRKTAPEILHIATPPESHGHYCALAADNGVKVVVCEKPLAERLAAAQGIAALHRSGRIKIITNHERRYAGDYGRGRALLAEGRLGRTLSASGKLCMGRRRQLLDLLWHDGTHLVDALMFLSGKKLYPRHSWGAPLSGRTGTAYLFGTLEDAGQEPGLPVLIELGAERDHLIFELEFSCEQGRFRIGNGLFEVWESGPSPYAASFRSLVRTGETWEGPTGYFSNMVKDAVRCALEGGREPGSSAVDGLEAIRCLEAVSAWERS